MQSLTELVLDHRQDQAGRAHLEQSGDIALVRIADDHMQPAIQRGHRVGLVAGVDDGTFQGGLEADLTLEEVRPLGNLETGLDHEAGNRGLMWRGMPAALAIRTMR